MLREVPDDLHRWLKQQAQAYHRSVNEAEWGRIHSFGRINSPLPDLGE
jgi:plasmid stability protein